MKLARFITVFSVLTGLMILQWPQPANCQMALSIAAACPMPCCKTMPMSSHCPKIQAQAPRDTMAASSISFVPVLHLLGQVTSVLSRPSTRPSFLAPTIELVRWLFLPRPALGRAPPTDVHLLSA